MGVQVKRLWLDAGPMQRLVIRKALEAHEQVVLVKGSVAQVAAVPGDARQIDFTISTATPDRYKDTIAVDGWDTDEYMRNPVVLWAHDYDQPPVGKALSVGPEDKALRSRAQFATKDEYPFADTVYQLLMGGYLNAVSVGFKPSEWTYDEERGGFNFLHQGLWEYSVVPVPANPEALQDAVQKGINLAPVLAWAERVLDAPNDHSALWVPKEAVERVRKVLAPAFQLSMYSHEVDPAGDTAEASADAVAVTETVVIEEGSATGANADAAVVWYKLGETNPPETTDADVEVAVGAQLAAIADRLEGLEQAQAEAATAVEDLTESINRLREGVLALVRQEQPANAADNAGAEEVGQDEVLAIIREQLTAVTGRLPREVTP